MPDDVPLADAPLADAPQDDEPQSTPFDRWHAKLLRIKRDAGAQPEVVGELEPVLLPCFTCLSLCQLTDEICEKCGNDPFPF